MSSIEKTIVVTGPKRSGTTLLNRLFDNHPALIDAIDEMTILVKYEDLLVVP